jgi:SAM-dependent methyltransferase
MKPTYKEIAKHYEDCLKKHGDNHLGMDWPRKEDADTRYQVMLDIIYFNKDTAPENSLLDFGCGTGHMLSYIGEKNISVNYSGLDISPLPIEMATRKYPDVAFYCLDVLEEKQKLPKFDYIVMNGVFTEKRQLTFEDMWDFFCRMLQYVFERSNKGVAFNVMSKNVAWEREDLFHVPQDMLTRFLCEKLSRNYIIRNDYGLFEYTVYIYK